MSTTGTIRATLHTCLLGVRMLVWCVVTVWLGFAALWKLAWFLSHIRQAFSRTLRCPRGHIIDAYAPLRCGRCGAAFEGHVFDPCPSCGATARFIPCRRCGLAVRNLLP